MLFHCGGDVLAAVIALSADNMKPKDIHKFQGRKMLSPF